VRQVFRLTAGSALEKERMGGASSRFPGVCVGGRETRGTAVSGVQIGKGEIHRNPLSLVLQGIREPFRRLIVEARPRTPIAALNHDKLIPF
jgi:hypothetical protein